MREEVCKEDPSERDAYIAQGLVSKGLCQRELSKKVKFTSLLTPLSSMDSTKTMLDILQLLNATAEVSKITLGDYTLVVEEYEIAPNTNKKYYNISKNSEEVISMAPLKVLWLSPKELNAKTNEKKETLIKLDAQYDSYLQEAASIKAKAKLVNESFKRDVYSAKHSNMLLLK